MARRPDRVGKGWNYKTFVARVHLCRRFLVAGALSAVSAYKARASRRRELIYYLLELAVVLSLALMLMI